MTRIELLAPAKDVACGVAAINSGADAVYIGGARFGARAAAGNDLAAIEALVAHAHRYWARVYVTVNTLLHDEELPAAVAFIEQLSTLGVDGVIIQDAGLLECDLPPIPLIASTQMHNHTPERVAFLERVGLKRAILARELSLEEIRAIRAATTLELECFIHGALCVGYSGQCYLSYALGGRSGNRGQCAQPCRKTYTLQDGRGKTLVRNRHLLSLRDLNLTAHLGDLLDAGVSSFKIEGRLKDRAYVMNVVSHYRRQLDAALEGRALRPASSGRRVIDFTPDVTKTFNRGYTTHFLHGRGAAITAPDTPKMTGEPMGRVATVGARSFTLEAEAPLRAGDGICFFNADHDLCGTTVNGVNGHLVTPAKLDGLTVGATIYRNHDHAFLSALNKSQPARLLGVTMTLRETATGFALTVTDEDGITASADVAAEKVPAEKAEQAQANMRKQLAKTGGTEYACTAVTLELGAAYFLPVATVNALRREALARLAEAREAARPRETGGAVRNDVPFPERELTFRGNVLNRAALAFYQRHGVTAIEPAAESGLDMRGRVVMTTKYCLKHELGLCPKEGTPQRLPEPLVLIDEEGRRLRVHCDCVRCVMEITAEG